MSETECSQALGVLEGLYDEFGEAVYRYALGMLGRREDAEDAVQAIWLRMARNAGRLGAVRNRKAYVWTSARNQVRSAYRSRGRDRLVGTDPESLAMFPTEENPRIDPDELRDTRRAMKRLSRKHREAVVLVGFEGLTLREAAERLGVPRGTVAGRYRTAVRKMARFLKREVSA